MERNQETWLNGTEKEKIPPALVTPTKESSPLYLRVNGQQGLFPGQQLRFQVVFGFGIQRRVAEFLGQRFDFGIEASHGFDQLARPELDLDRALGLQHATTRQHVSVPDGWTDGWIVSRA